MGAMATPGDHVDLISSSGQTVAAGILVLAVDAGAADSGGWSATAGTGPPGGVVVAVSSDEAMRLAKTDPSGLSDVACSLVLLSPGTGSTIARDRRARHASSPLVQFSTRYLGSFRSI